MTAERESIDITRDARTGQLGVEERRDEAPGASDQVTRGFNSEISVNSSLAIALGAGF